mgnify:CR=1 FL=1
MKIFDLFTSRSNRKIRESLKEANQTAEFLCAEVARLRAEVSIATKQMDTMQKTQDTIDSMLEEKNNVPSTYNYDAKIMERLKADILTSFYNYYDTITTTEEFRLHKAMEDDVKMVFDNLETELGEIESGKLDQLFNHE